MSRTVFRHDILFRIEDRIGKLASNQFAIPARPGRAAADFAKTLDGIKGSMDFNLRLRGSAEIDRKLDELERDLGEELWYCYLESRRRVEMAREVAPPAYDDPPPPYSE